MSQPPARAVDDRHRQMLWEPAITFLKFAFVFVLAGSAAFLVALFVFAPDQIVRALGPASTALVALVAQSLLSRGRTEAAVRVLGYGFWAAVTVIAFFTGGVNGMAIIVYPQIILLLGWMISTRAAVAMAALTIATTLCFTLAETWGMLPPAPPTPPILRWLVQSLVFAFAVVLFVYVVRAYQNRLNEVSELDRDLNRAQAVAHVGSWVYDLGADTLRLSAETCRIFGLPVGTTGKHDSYLARVHPDDRARVDGAWQAALQRGATFDDEHRILVGDTVRWVRQIAELQLREDGTPLRSVGTTQEVTERRLARVALESSEQRFRDLLQSVPSVAVQGYSMGGTTQYWNRASELLYGYTAQEAIGRNLLDLIIPPEMREGVSGAVAQMAETGRAIPAAELSLMRKDGSRVTVYSSHAIVQIPGRAPELFCIDLDLTELRRHETEALAARSQLEATLAAIPDLMFEVGLDGRFYQYHSPRTELLAAPPEQFLGRTIMEIMPLRVADVCLSALREAHETGRSQGKQFELPLPQGIFWFELSISRKAVEPGQEPRFIVLSRDITERKRAEAARVAVEGQLRESQKMEALGTLAGGVAHDFNNIVAAIIGNVELARQDVGEEHPALESLEEIRKAGRRAKNLVQQILAFGRRQVLARKVISLAPAIEETVRLLRSTLPAGINLAVECAPDAPEVLADATQIEQVLLNLCNNAWQALQAQSGPGTIEIRLAAHVVDGAPYQGPERRCKGERVPLQPGRYACLSVSDNGPGMDRATRSHIFEPFFTTKPVGEGTGLGLAVVHGIAHDHDASIVVQSAPGEGAAFRIFFPAVQAPSALAADRGAGADEGKTLVLQGEGKHVLYLDDDEAIVFLMTRLLQRQGYRVSGHTDPHAALAAVRADPGAFDLVVTDYNMPGASGLEVAQALQKIRPDLPVALASGYITEELQARAPAAGVRELIYKPNSAEDFCQVVARLVNTLPA